MPATTTPAAAQFFGWTEPPPRPSKRIYPYYYRQSVPHRQARPVQRHDDARAASEKRDRVKGEPKTPPSQMVFAVVSLANQRVSVYGSDGLITTSAVSTGQSGHRTPTGIFTILEKQRWHEFNIYSGAPMPFMQRITWSGIAMHLGVVPGYPASHGCIRLPSSFAPKLWEMTKVGLRVMIAPHDVTPVAFNDSRLPVPKLVSAAEFSPPPSSLPPSRAPDTARPILVAGGQLAAADPQPTPAEPRMLNPIEAAVAMKSRAASTVAAAKKAAEVALKVAREASQEANTAVKALRDAKDDLDEFKTRGDPEDKIAELQKAYDAAKADEEVKTPRSFELARAAREAEQAAEKAQEDVTEAVRRQSPVTVVISKKEASILVKQGKKPVYEGPINIKDPAKPLGTHLYMATAAAEGGKGLKWVSLTAAYEPEKPQRSGRRSRDAEPVHSSSAPPSNAAEAFDRVELPADVMAQLASLFWIGSSIVITDRGLSNENGEHTDLIVAIP